MAAMFEHLVRVRWRDTDALGHVNHAVFLTYLRVDGWVLVPGDEGELTRLADQPPGAIPDFAVLLKETGGDEPG
jgi:hypothetical protein